MSDFEFPRNPDGSLRTRKTEENMPGGRGYVYKALHGLNDGLDYIADGVESGAEWVGETASDGYDYARETASDVYDTVSEGAGDAVDYVEDTASDTWNGAKELFGGLF